LHDKECTCISTKNPFLFRYFYLFGCALLDEIQLRGKSTDQALKVVSDQFRDLISEVSVLSDQKQTGLIGELCFLRTLASIYGWPQALASWHSDERSEHDFDLGEVDLEVKSTLSEKRSHIIGSLTQLNPTSGRALYLVSYQFTKAGTGNPMTLTSLHDEVLASIKINSPNLSTRFESRVHSAGWQDEHRSFYRLKVRVRTSPMLMAVDQGFPALVPAVLGGFSPEMLVRISDVSYRLDVEGLGNLLDESVLKLIIDDNARGKQC
jgi:Putative  PD-(D/E)XK family member, (DUF4420)